MANGDLRFVWLAVTLLGLAASVNAGRTFAGRPIRKVAPDRHAPLATRRHIHSANGHTWPQRHKFKSWPPQPDGQFSDKFLHTRAQLEASYRKVPLNVHHRLDDFEELAQTMILPRFTPVGFKVMDAPKALWEDLRKNYLNNVDTTDTEEFAGHATFPGMVKPRFIRNHEQRRLNNEVAAQLKPICEEWASVPLIHSTTYGVRIYGNGSTLFNHVDTPATHIVSAIVHIDHKLDEPWPLQIEDHEGTVHSVSLEPGQMVLYESASQFHSRVTPMMGHHYGSVFTHFRPHGWDWKPEDVIAAVPPDWNQLQPDDPSRLDNVGISQLEDYTTQWYAARGLPVLEFAGNDLLSLPVQNAAMMIPKVDHNRQDL